jgi:LmbE family N-acetylglucosaminyl deacetylase
MSKKVYLMVIAPHPDDSEFGIAGTAARLAREGKKVVYVICTSGDKGSSDLNIRPQELTIIREHEQRAAARVLGVTEVVFLGYPDQGLEDTAEFRKDLVRVIRQYRPYVVATVDPYRRYMWHRDHRITGQVALDAVYPYARDHLAYPDLMEAGLEPHKVREVWCWASEDVNFRSDITDTFNLKLAALGCHRSQFGEKLPLKMKKMLRERARDMAEGESYELAEAFHRVEMRY